VSRCIALETTVDERLGQIQGDERKIRQVLLNLHGGKMNDVHVHGAVNAAPGWATSLAVATPTPSRRRHSA